MRKFFGFAIVALLVCGQAFAQQQPQPSPSDVTTTTAQTVVEPTAVGMPAPVMAAPMAATADCGCGNAVVSSNCGCANTVSTCAPQTCNTCCDNGRRILARRNNCCNNSCGCSVPVTTCAPQVCNDCCYNDCCNNGRRVLARRNNCCNNSCNVATTSCCQPVVVAPLSTDCNTCGSVVSTGCATPATASACCEARPARVRAMPVRTGGLRLRRGC